MTRVTDAELERMVAMCASDVTDDRRALLGDAISAELLALRKVADAASDALRRLLADVRSARSWANSPSSEDPCPPLASFEFDDLDYLERLALDGLAGEAMVPRSPWRLAPSGWACTHESDCDWPAKWSDGEDQGACDMHALAMGVFKPTEDGQP